MEKVYGPAGHDQCKFPSHKKEWHTLYFHLELHTVDVVHALDLAKGYIIAVLQTVPALIESSDQPRLVDSRQDSAHGILASWIDNRKLRTEVAENASEETVGARGDKGDVFLVAIFIDPELLGQRVVGQDNRLVARQLR